jgi:hypothetical protein
MQKYYTVEIATLTNDESATYVALTQHDADLLRHAFNALSVVQGLPSFIITTQEQED